MTTSESYFGRSWTISSLLALKEAWQGDEMRFLQYNDAVDTTAGILRSNNTGTDRVWSHVTRCFRVVLVACHRLSGGIVDATIDVFNTITKELLPTPQKSHYTFNLRDLAKVFQGTQLQTCAGITFNILCSVQKPHCVATTLAKADVLWSFRQISLGCHVETVILHHSLQQAGGGKILVA